MMEQVTLVFYGWELVLILGSLVGTMIISLMRIKRGN